MYIKLIHAQRVPPELTVSTDDEVITYSAGALQDLLTATVIRITAAALPTPVIQVIVIII